jgi:chromosome segregation protein
MKLLERVGLVQFFLYEREDLRIGKNTAFLGPNGTGKTSLLDAIQAVMLAVDAHRTHFNAQADGKKRARTLRDYCLGVFDQTPDGRKRDSSNTYINLVFRDEETGAVVSAGVSLSANIESSELQVNGFYILPEVDLETVSQVERTPDGERALTWKRFQQDAALLCRAAGTLPQAYFGQNREDFIRRLLLEHLAAPGDKPNPQSFRNAFQRSLQLKSMDDLSTALRDHLIESHPVNVREFRQRLEQFREMRDTVRRTKEQIERAETVAGRYKRALQKKTDEVSLRALKAVYESEHLGSLLAEGEDQVHELGQSLDTARVELHRATAAVTTAELARDRARDALHQDPAYAQQGGVAAQLSDRKERLAKTSDQLTRTLRAMEDALLKAGRHEDLEKHQGVFEDAIAEVQQLGQALTTGQTPESVAVASALRRVEQAHQVVRRAQSEADHDLKALEGRLREARTTVERASRGLAPLSPQVATLQRVLEEQGIPAEPVCDLVRVTDPNWQPVVEAYLGRHVEALLVPRGREEGAIRVYRSLKGPSAVYGVKLALPARMRAARTPEPRQAAALIEGDNADAVAYLRGELGAVECVSTERELVAGRKAMTREGMIATGGGVERRRLDGSDSLRIGRKDQGTLAQQARLQLDAVQDATASARKRAEAMDGLARSLAPFADAERMQQDIEGLLADVSENQALAARLADQLQLMQTPTMDGLSKAAEAANAHLVGSRDRQRECQTNLTKLEITLETAQKQLLALSEQRKLAAVAEREARLDALYDPNEVERHRQRIDERFQELREQMKACDEGISAAARQGGEALGQATELMKTYLVDYHQTNNDLDLEGDWRRAYSYVLREVERLRSMALVEQEQRAEDAYKAALRIFRSDVANALIAGFDRIEEQIRGLNLVLKHAPVFSNNERYQFRSRVVDMHRPLYDFLQRVREAGTGDGDMFGDPGEVPAEFRGLLEGDASSALLHDGSPLADHRRFFAFDVEIHRDGKSVGYLSKRFGPGSGGEHRTPLYVIFGAALAAAYGNVQGRNRGGGIMLLDEAFDKMDTQNVRAAAEYLNSLGLQLIMAGPETDQPKLSSFLDVYYDMGRYGGTTIQMDMTVLSPATRALLQSDNPLVHPELLQQEIARLKGESDEPVPANA